MNRSFLLIVLLIPLLAFGQGDCDWKDFEYLLSACRKSALTSLEFNTYLKAVKKMEDSNCHEYVEKRDSVLVDIGLTYLLGQLCIRANSDESVREYVNYLNRHSGSAEEERSFSFEYIFKQNPKRVLKLIGFNTEHLDHLAWGFMNNRYYGENDPYERDPNKPHRKYETEPKRALTVKTYKDIFFKTYPSLKDELLYKQEIDYLLKTIATGIKELYE